MKGNACRKVGQRPGDFIELLRGMSLPLEPCEREGDATVCAEPVERISHGLPATDQAIGPSAVAAHRCTSPIADEGKEGLPAELRIVADRQSISKTGKTLEM